MARMDYSDFQEFGREMIEEFGGDITINIKGAQTYDPATGGMVGVDVVTVVRAVMEPYQASEQLVSDRVVTSKTQKLTIAGEVNAGVADTVDIGPDTYSIKGKRVTKPNIGTTIITELVVSL